MKRCLGRLAFAVMLAAAFACPVSAQSPREQRNAAPGVFDFYVLALSWSPGFCELSGSRDRDQCSLDGSIGKGFVVHGLWPQFTRGYPVECRTDRMPTRAAVEAAIPPYPTAGLARYQWRRHGSCSGLDPSSYYRAVRTAKERVSVPAEFIFAPDAPRFRPIEIERKFIAENQGLGAGMMSVQCRRGLLQEIRICLSKDLRSFIACPEVDRDSCRSGSITMSAMNVPE
jgi:ribonuclease T2